MMGVQPAKATGTMVERESNAWDQIKAKLATRITSQAYQNWVMRTAFEGMDGRVLRVVVPDEVTKDWMEQEYAEDIRAVIREANLNIEQIVYSPHRAFSAPATEGGAMEPIFASAVGQINPKFR